MSVAASQARPSVLERYATLFEERARATDALAPDALTLLRRAALDRFLAEGFPTQRHEEWKYTNLRRLESRSFTATSDPTVVTAELRGHIASLDRRIVLVNGFSMAALSTAAPQPPGLTMLPLRQWLANAPNDAAAFLARLQPEPTPSFEALNTAFCDDGVVIELSEGAQLDEPLYVLHAWNGAGQLRMSHPRLIVRAGRGSRCTLVEHYLAMGDAESFTNAVTSIEIGDNASVTHYRIQQESPRSFHIGSTRVLMQRDSRYDSHSFALGASLGRHSITSRLEQSGAAIVLNGLFAPAGSQHLDMHTRTEHVAPQTTSSEEYRGIGMARGRGVFNGKVVVQPGAQKTDARQSSRNLLLSAGAEIDSRPELEIYADDVKCSHGATTGQLDAAATFYLRSRGLSEQEARAVLIRAFADSLVSTIECGPVRAHLEQALQERFATGVAA